MGRLKSAWEFCIRHKAKWGSVLLAVGGLLAGWGPRYDAWSKVLLALGGLLVGAGVVPSDAATKAKQDWDKIGIDRRTNE